MTLSLVLRVAKIALNVADNFTSDMTPAGKSIALLSYAVSSLAEALGGPEAPKPSPNVAKIVAAIDADNDGIADHADGDGGTVPAVTDEMIRAGLATLDRIMTSDTDYSHAKSVVEIYLAMAAIRPK